MCGACGAGSTRTGRLHWSSPFLASTTARSASAQTLTRWARLTGWTGTVSGVAGGFQVATASGRRWLGADLGEVLDLLERGGPARSRLLAQSTASGVVEGPPTCPGLRSRPDNHELAGDRVQLPQNPRRPYRVPGLLAWLSAAEGTGRIDGLGLQIGVGAGRSIRLTTHDGLVASCEVTAAAEHGGARDLLVSTAGSPPSGLVALLG